MYSQKDDGGSRPYRWASTPLDPLREPPNGKRPRRDGDQPRRKRYLAVLVVIGLLIATNWIYKQTKANAPGGVALHPPATTLPINNQSTRQIPSTAMPAATSAAPTAPPTTIRPGGVATDQGRALGESATVNGIEGSAQSATRSTDGALLVNVVETNTSNTAKQFGIFDWQLQFPDGHIEDMGFSLDGNRLPNGTLVPGGHASGSVPFQLNGAKGAFFIIFGGGINSLLSGSASPPLAIWPIHIN